MESLAADKDDLESDALLPPAAATSTTAASLNWNLLSLALPLTLRFLLFIGANLLQLALAPRYASPSTSSAVLIAALSLANMFANISCLSFLVGLGTVVSTLASQYNGAKEYRQVGLTLQRSLLIMTLLVIPLIPLWYFAESFWRKMGVDAQVCLIIGEFLRIRLLNLPADIVRESYEAFLMSLGVMHFPMLGSITLDLSLLLINLLGLYLGYRDYRNLIYIYVFCNYLSLLVQILASWSHSAVQRTLQPFDKAAFQEWGDFLRLGVPSILMLCSEWWAYELLVVMATFLGTQHIDAQAILFQLIYLAFMIPMGVGTSLATLTGNSLGNNSIVEAKKICWHALRMSSCVELFVGVAMFSFGKYFIAFFTSDPDIVAIAVEALPLVSVYVMFDGMQAIACGVLRGAGKQYIGAYLNGFAFYVVGLPLAWVFCFNYDMGVKGLVMGISVASSIQFTVMLYLITCRDDLIFVPFIAVADNCQV